MTTRAGYVLAVVASGFASSTETRPRSSHPGGVVVNATTVGRNPPRYKNSGYYVAGGVWETWITTPLPGTTPPSGHTLTQLQHLEVEAS